MTICYFTASGNCLYVARRIGGNLLSIPKLMRQDEITIEDDVVGIVAPCYAAEMPVMVREFIRKADIRTDYFFFIYTYGMGYGEAFAHVKLECEAKGLKLSYINAVQMVDNYLPIFKMQDQINTLPQKNVEGHLEKIITDIQKRKEIEIKINALTRMQMSMYSKRLAKPILRKDTAREYIVTSDCIKCGICAKVCPADNIKVTDKVEFLDKCEVCYACLHNCPKNAIHLQKEASPVRFRNEYVTIEDIIEANE